MLLRLLDLGLAVEGVFPIMRTILFQFKLALHVASILLGCVVAPVAFSTLERDDLNRTLLRLRQSHSPLSHAGQYSNSGNTHCQ